MTVYASPVLAKRRDTTQPKELKVPARPPHKSSAPTLQNSFLHTSLVFLVASFPKVIYTKKTGRARVDARTVPDHK